MARVTTKMGDIFQADLSSTLEWQLWAFGSYEPHIAELFSLLVRPGDRCIDVGANVGVHTVRLAKLVGREGEVIAVEPDPSIVRRTQHNVALNDLANVRIVNAAASERRRARCACTGQARGTPTRARASLLHHSYLTGVTSSMSPWSPSMTSAAVDESR